MRAIERQPRGRPRASGSTAPSAPARPRSRCSSPRRRKDAGRSYAVYPVPRLLAEIKRTFDRDASDTYLGFFRRLCTVDLLVLDDLGAEKQTEWVLEQLYSIVNERWQDQRSIVVTTNMPDADADAAAGHAARRDRASCASAPNGARPASELRAAGRRASSGWPASWRPSSSTNTLDPISGCASRSARARSRAWSRSATTRSRSWAPTCAWRRRAPRAAARALHSISPCQDS